MSQNRTFVFRFVAVAALLGGTAVFLATRTRPEPTPSRVPLPGFPAQVGDLIGQDIGIDSSVREVLGPGEFLNRVYQHGGEPYVSLFVGYFPSQRTGNTIHSPKNCLPGSGWSPLESGHVQLHVPQQPPLTVNRYIIGKGVDRQVVLYWYQAHNRVLASEYWAKFYLVADAIHMNRTDGAIVRVVSPISPDEPAAAADQRAVWFAEQIFPALDRFIPR